MKYSAVILTTAHKIEPHCVTENLNMTHSCRNMLFYTPSIITVIFIIRLIYIVIIFQFNGYLLTCRLNSKTAYYRANTNTTQKQYKHKTKTLNRQNKNNMAGKKQYKRSTGANPLNHEKQQISGLNSATDWRRICFNVVTDFLKISTTSLHARTHTHTRCNMAVLIFRHFITLVYKHFPHKSRSTHPSNPASFLHQQKTQDNHTKQTAWCAQWTAFLYA
jgi:hypothetical protein